MIWSEWWQVREGTGWAFWMYAGVWKKIWKWAGSWAIRSVSKRPRVIDNPYHYPISNSRWSQIPSINRCLVLFLCFFIAAGTINKWCRWSKPLFWSGVIRGYFHYEVVSQNNCESKRLASSSRILQNFWGRGNARISDLVSSCSTWRGTLPENSLPFDGKKGLFWCFRRTRIIPHIHIQNNYGGW